MQSEDCRDATHPYSTRTYFVKICVVVLPDHRTGEGLTIISSQCHHWLDRWPCPFVRRVSRSLECGSVAAAPAMLTMHARVTPFTLLVTGIRCVLVTIMESVSIEITSSNPIMHRWESWLPSRNITQVRYESTELSTNNICTHPTQSSYRHLKQPAY